MVKLLQGMQTAAFLADCGCYHEALELLKALDTVAMGLEIYKLPVYQLARSMLIAYISRVADEPGDWTSRL